MQALKKESKMNRYQFDYFEYDGPGVPRTFRKLGANLADALRKLPDDVFEDIFSALIDENNVREEVSEEDLINLLDGRDYSGESYLNVWVIDNEGEYELLAGYMEDPIRQEPNNEW